LFCIITIRTISLDLKAVKISPNNFVSHIYKVYKKIFLVLYKVTHFILSSTQNIFSNYKGHFSVLCNFPVQKSVARFGQKLRNHHSPYKIKEFLKKSTLYLCCQNVPINPRICQNCCLYQKLRQTRSFFRSGYFTSKHTSTLELCNYF